MMSVKYDKNEDDELMREYRGERDEDRLRFRTRLTSRRRKLILETG